jgi:hypothetical protein
MSSLLQIFGNETVRLTSSNAYSDGEVELTLRAYLSDLNKLSAGSCRAANDTVYLFGGNYGPNWLALIEKYTLPPCTTCRYPADNTAVSFGIGGLQSGVSWHRHGPGFSEVFHGAKRWFLIPPNGPLDIHDFNANKSVAQWASEDLPQLRETSGVVECTIRPGELLYFPANWPHATLNLDAYTSFASTFLILE